MHLTIAYMTNRRENHVEWFVDSLKREISNHGQGLKIRTIMIDFFADERKGSFGFDIHVPPKPTVWQGKSRLTSKDYFAPSNARNTAICLAPDGYIAFVDDLSVLTHDWFLGVRGAIAGNHVACGFYCKLKNLVVSKGEIISGDEFPAGKDGRMSLVANSSPVQTAGGHLFGGAMAGPVEHFVRVNGFDEDCDPSGLEDCITGMYMQRQGSSFYLYREMLHIESEEGHYKENPFPRVNKMCPDESLLRFLRKVQSGERTMSACFYPEGFREVRRKTLAGEPFPFYGEPVTHWQDLQPISEM